MGSLMSKQDGKPSQNSLSVSAEENETTHGPVSLNKFRFLFFGSNSI